VGIRNKREENPITMAITMAMEKRGECPITNNQCPLEKWGIRGFRGWRGFFGWTDMARGTETGSF